MLCAHRPCVNSVKSWFLPPSPTVSPRLSPPAVSPSLYHLFKRFLFSLFYRIAQACNCPFTILSKIYATNGILESTLYAALRCESSSRLESSIRSSFDRPSGDCRLLIRAIISSLQLRRKGIDTTAKNSKTRLESKEILFHFSK